MHTARFDRLTRHAAGRITRRGSLKTLGGSALAAAAAIPSNVHAGKIGKKVKKRLKKKCGRQVEQCQSALSEFCDSNPRCEEIHFPCCSALSDCKSGTSLDCFFLTLNR